MLNNPKTIAAKAEPITIEGIITFGLFAAKGIAPSVIKETPNIHADAPISRSSLFQSLGKKVVENASPSGGSIPPSIT